MEEILRQGLAELGIDPPPGAIPALREYGERLLGRTAVVNLTAIRDPEGVARLHFLDCAALLTAADFAGKKVIDIGTGAGFPGIPLKLLRPDIRLTVLDGAGKKIDFIRESCAVMGIEAECLWGRVEDMPELKGAFDIAVSRAVAEMDVLSELCLPQVGVGGVFIAMKGPDCGDEVEKADYAVRAMGGRVREIVRYTIPGTDVTHAAVIIEKVRPTPEQYPRRYAQIRKKPLRG